MIAKGAAKPPLALSRREVLAATSLLPGAISNFAPQPPWKSVSPVFRTPEGRFLSRCRYRNGESFFLAIEEMRFADPADLLYYSGIVAQLALSSHLLDVGFDDRWCARNIGLHIDKALACANATGLNFQSPELDQLAVVLSPYNKWRNSDLDKSRAPLPASLPNIPLLLRALLDHVQAVTGHPRPRRRKARG